MQSSNQALQQQHVRRFLRRLHLERWSRRYNPTAVLAAFNLVNGGLSIALMATVALLTQQAFIFPSLGATAVILYYMPLNPAASPRNATIGHFLGALMGWLSLHLFGLADAAPAILNEVDWPRVAAASLSLGATGCAMVLLRAVHPPAGATALIVSLGLMPGLAQIPVLLGAVWLLLAKAFIFNRLAGIPYPLWSGIDDAAPLLVSRPAVDGE